MTKELLEKVYDLIKEKSENHAKIMEQALQQAILTGEVLVKINENGEPEIVNPFKGCNCNK